VAAQLIPEQGQLVQVRNRHYVVLDVDEHVDNGKLSRKLRLECLDDDALGDELEVIWEREVAAEVYDTSYLPRPDAFERARHFLCLHPGVALVHQLRNRRPSADRAFLWRGRDRSLMVGVISA